MIEFPITLTSGGSVCLSGHAFALALGYTKNRGVYRLHVDATGEWEGLAIRCFWHVPDGKAPASSLVVDGYVAVPASVTAQPGSGCITFEGSDGAKVMTSAHLRYRVSANSGTEDGTEPEPGTPAWQQLVAAVHTDATAAEQAKTDAQTAAQQAGASAKKAGQALSDTITAKEDALKAIGDKQAAATQAVDTARDKALQQVEASTEAAQTAASEAATSAGNASQSAQKAAGSLQELKEGIAAGDFKGEPGNDGKSPIVTVTDIENGHRVSITDKDGTKTIDVLNGQTGKTGATPVLTIGTVSSGDKPSADITGTPENPVLNLRLQPGPQGPAVALDTTLTHEGEAADAKATGDAISAVKVRQNVLTGSETGNPLSVDDAFPAPPCGLTVYGKSTQDGTPTPDVPVPIVSAGDGGSLTVKVTGKNLFYEQGFQQYFINSVADSVGLAVGNVSSVLQVVTGAKYYVTRNKIGTKFRVAVVDALPTKGSVVRPSSAINADSKRQVEISAASKYMVIQCEDEAAFSELMVSLDSSTAYSPYREQLLTLPTPTGLPGIPVTSGGSYTDSTGQQWVCDEVDLERGVRVQRVGKTQVNTKNGTPEETHRLRIPFSGNGKSGNFDCIISVTPFTSWTSCVNDRFLYLKNVPKSDGSFYTGEELLALAIDVDFVYQLATPIETPLTPDELSAYKALAAYAPDTVVQAGDGAGIKLDYQRDVNLVVKNLEDAIASMTTT